MKAVSTALIASVVAPKTSENILVQITSKTRPLAPERKKQATATQRMRRGW